VGSTPAASTGFAGSLKARPVRDAEWSNART
jgi:hypothetical protein